MQTLNSNFIDKIFNNFSQDIEKFYSNILNNCLYKNEHFRNEHCIDFLPYETAFQNLNLNLHLNISPSNLLVDISRPLFSRALFYTCFKTHYLKLNLALLSSKNGIIILK